MKRIVFYIAFLIFSLAGVDEVQAQNMQTSVDKKSILIGERIYYNIQFSFDNRDFTVDFGTPDSIDHFEIMGKVVVDTVIDNKYVVRQQMVLTSWDSGRWVIPTIPIKLTNARNRANVYNVSSPIHTIDVGYTAMDSTDQLRDIKPVLPVRVSNTPWWYWLIGGLLALILLYSIYRYLKKRPVQEKPVFESSLTAYEEAMKEFDELSKMDLVNRTSIRQYHSAAADIFRRYLSRKKGKSLMHHTTGEILQLMKDDNPDGGLLTDVASGLRSADAVKFAKYEPLPDQSKTVVVSLRSAVETIEKTLK